MALTKFHVYRAPVIIEAENIQDAANKYARGLFERGTVTVVCLDGERKNEVFNISASAQDVFTVEQTVTVRR